MNTQTPLTPMAQHVQKGGTEPPFSSPLLKEKRTGFYHCCVCDAKLFVSTEKYDSGTGWPSFHQSLNNALETREDHSLPEKRVEILCAKCHTHLGHVFPDGPKGMRHCVNGCVIHFEEKISE